MIPMSTLYPYFLRVTHKTTDSYTDLTRDQTTSVQWLAMTDGSTMAAETPQSVSARALLSQNLCMGGLSGWFF
jgi:hypothetical protein